jgi:serine/threonine protein kinase
MMQLMRDASPNRWNRDNQERRVGSFIIREQLGEGTTGTVHVAVNSIGGKSAAVKIVNKCMPKKVKEARKEIKILEKFEHPNLIKLEQVHEDDSKLYIFMEHCELGDLYTFVQNNSTFNENVARVLFFQMVEAINFCHKRIRYLIAFIVRLMKFLGFATMM